MKTSELIEFFQSQPFTEDQGFNLLTSDINEALTDEELAAAPSQKLIRYFMYKIQAVMLSVIQAQKAKLESVARVSQMETPLVVAGLKAESTPHVCETCGGHRNGPTVTCVNHDQWVPKQ